MRTPQEIEKLVLVNDRNENAISVLKSWAAEIINECEKVKLSCYDKGTAPSCSTEKRQKGIVMFSELNTEHWKINIDKGHFNFIKRQLKIMA